MAILTLTILKWTKDSQLDQVSGRRLRKENVHNDVNWWLPLIQWLACANTFLLEVNLFSVALTTTTTNVSHSSCIKRSFRSFAPACSCFFAFSHTHTLTYCKSRCVYVFEVKGKRCLRNLMPQRVLFKCWVTSSLSLSLLVPSLSLSLSLNLLNDTQTLAFQQSSLEFAPSQAHRHITQLDDWNFNVTVDVFTLLCQSICVCVCVLQRGCGCVSCKT